MTLSPISSCLHQSFIISMSNEWVERMDGENEEDSRKEMEKKMLKDSSCCCFHCCGVRAFLMERA
ncbi:hypothetical protein IC582_024754 [Cucumis melo]